ncbi:MAG TPA: sulfatase-like hydrolase/transferase, partial [Chloroflexota bacterium]|nr:sulfatase-like hydrolase/transferase [Chloroflexota bacterium]
AGGAGGAGGEHTPFFHVCSFHGPHPVFVIPEPYYSLYDPAQAPQPPNFDDPMDGKPAFQRLSIWHQAAYSHGTVWDQWRKSMAVYWGYITWLDELIGRVLGRLESLGLAENTIVMMTTDHGEMMGAHGLFQKSCMYEESLRVPCLVRAPGMVPAGRRVDAPVSHVDFAPTLLSLCGLSVEGTRAIEPQGRDLSAWLTGDEAPPPANRGATDDPAAGAVFCEYTPHSEGERMTDIRCAAGPRFKYAWNRDDVPELYDTWTDPAELHNLAASPSHAAIRSRLHGALVEWMRRTGDHLVSEVEGAAA